MSFVVQASIGRNIGDQPMSKKDWTRFLNDVSDTLRNQGEIPEMHFGVGIWDGVSEESVHITVFREETNFPVIETITARLAILAKKYGQDAIALTVGTSILVKP